MAPSFQNIPVDGRLLEVKSLRCARDDRVLFDQLDFTLDAGELIQVEGANGSGKTTLLRALSGLSSAYNGEIFWCGEPLKKVRQSYFSDLQYLGHLPGVKTSLTPRENLQWLATLSLECGISALEAALKKVGLQGFEDVPCFTLSAGQQRRVALARLYLSSAKLWILDEPFTAIDKQGVAELEELIRQHMNQGGAIILTTHQAIQLESDIKKVQLG